MSDDVKLDINKLEKLYAETIALFPPPSFVSYEIDENGVVHLFGAHGEYGMTTREALQYLLDNAPKETPDAH
jgi:hypothetical protein